MTTRHRAPRNRRQAPPRYEESRSRPEPDPETTLDEGPEELPFVHAGQAGVGAGQAVVQRIGDAIIGGDFSGNARGSGAIDIQISRTDPTHVASGDRSIVFGSDVEGSGPDSVSFGASSYAKGDSSVALGCVAMASKAAALAVGTQSGAGGTWSAALGPDAIASADYSVALGSGARAYVARAANMAIPWLAQQGGGHLAASQWYYNYATSEIFILSDLVDLKVVADETVALPSGAKLWLSEVGVIVTHLTALTTQPTIRFGIAGSPAKHLAATLCTQLTAVGKREKWTPLTDDGETDLSVGVTVAAVAATLKGRWFWRGLLVENEA